MNVQPNFEKLKVAFYNYVIRQSEVDIYSALQSVSNNDFRLHRVKRDEFVKDMNTWLDQLDIRSAAKVIDILKEKGATIPAWMKNKQFTIDYNNHEALDLIPYPKND